MSRKEYTGSFGPLLWALDRRDGLTGTTWAVLVAIAKHCDPKGRCHPSMKTLSEVACISERTVKSAVADLEELGYVRLERGNGRGNSSNYRLPFSLASGRFRGPESGNGKDESAAPFSAPVKGEPAAPFVHPKGEPAAPFSGPERVQILSIKGEAAAPQLPKEESSKGNLGGERPESDIPARAARARPLPADWKPDPGGERFAAGLGLDPDSVAQGFRDHRLANGTQRVDWAADFRWWCQREARDHQPKRRPASSAFENGQAVAAMINARFGHTEAEDAASPGGGLVQWQ